MPRWRFPRDMTRPRKRFQCWFGFHRWTLWVSRDEAEIYFRCQDCKKPSKYQPPWTKGLPK